MTDVPEVRQCRNPDESMFGAVAVRAGENRWGIMHPEIGGHWASDKEVEKWDSIRT